MSLASIRTELARQIRNEAGIRAYDYEPLKPEFPCAVVGWPETYDLRSTFEGSTSFTLPVRVEVPLRQDRAADDKLETIVEATGSSSIAAAIATDVTLNGSCDSALATEVTGFGLRETQPEVWVLTATIVVEVLP